MLINNYVKKAHDLLESSNLNERKRSQKLSERRNESSNEFRKNSIFNKLSGNINFNRNNSFLYKYEKHNNDLDFGFKINQTFSGENNNNNKANDEKLITESIKNFKFYFPNYNINELIEKKRKLDAIKLMKSLKKARKRDKSNSIFRFLKKNKLNTISPSNRISQIGPETEIFK